MQHLLRQIAYRGNQRTVTVCEDGLLALRWQRSIVFLHPHELIHAYRTLRHWTQQSGRPFCGGRSVNCFCDSSGAVQLWMYGVGFYLTGGDFVALVDLLQTTVDMLSEENDNTDFRGSEPTDG
ncbi:MAG: hypothetical protein GFH27_549293n135 [Chloroflexi bacterium AL-W]|nr:hypothetical protein [Chloroflexi bacterium AL-N1]NOK67750.1 hypothetical protein [Chloroflexi bacterium AL-N10]NOK75480.1 hypothetical protein [Chloroflexi bacterium AL-N5]NOK82268.1 hypothetical protein [Chloroflexi bacterium AL-W]NOK90113.1 hypothetical protein [Chloroflexi bacterium AL-N15]